MTARRGVLPVYLTGKNHHMAVITSLSMTAGVQAHVTIGDANASNAPLPDSTITWQIFPPGNLVITADPAGGFFFDAATPTGGNPVDATATYSAGSVHIQMPVLHVTVAAAVAPVYLSP